MSIPKRLIAHLTGIGLVVTNIALKTGISRLVELGGFGGPLP